MRKLRQVVVLTWHMKIRCQHHHLLTYSLGATTKSEARGHWNKRGFIAGVLEQQQQQTSTQERQAAAIHPPSLSILYL
eukprot:scaffold31109_cov175-Amphora_coffeaeformis.AAC.4